MSMASDILRDVFNAIGADVKAFFSKFDANGKLLKTYLPALTKADVGLSNVDNTADKDKVVAKSAMLQSPFTLTLGNVLQGYVTIDGSGSVTMANGNLNTTKAFSTLFNGSDYQDNSSIPNNYSAGTRAKCLYNPPSGNYNEIAYGGSITTIGMADGVNLQTLLPFPYAGYYINPFSGMFVRQITTRYGSYNSAANYKWVPISTSTYTYNTTTTEAPNVYVGADGVLLRSTNVVKAPIILTATMPAAGSSTTIAHGLTSDNILAINARVTGADGVTYWPNDCLTIDSQFAVRVNGANILIANGQNSTNIAGMTATISVVQK